MTQYIRHTAIKVPLSVFLQSELVQEQDVPSYLSVRDEKIYRMNVIGIIIGKEEVGSIVNLYIDDGTGTALLRFFEENKIAKEVSVGQVVLCIGKPRMYSNQRYISHEIIKIVDPRWLKLRSIEIKKQSSEPQKVEEEKIIEKEEVKEQEEEIVEDEKILPIEKIRSLIVELDSGDGVAMEEILEKSPINNTEELLEKMMQQGDIFQNKPGKVKVL